MYKFFSAEHSIFSAKVRAYLRFKHDQNDLGAGFEDILATPDLMTNLLTVRSGSPSLPNRNSRRHGYGTLARLLTMSKQHRNLPVIPDCETRPKQSLPVIFWSFWAMSGCWYRPAGSAGIMVGDDPADERLMSNNGAHFWRQ